MAHPPRPRHLGDVHQSLDARLQLHEGAVVGEAHHAPPDLGAGGVGLLDPLPRVGRLLLVAERHPPALAVEVQNDDLDLIPDLEDLGGVTDAAPAHVRHMQEAVDAAQVDEGSVVGDVLHGPGEDHALGEHLQRVLLLLLALLLQHGTARENHVAPPTVELDDPGPHGLPDHRSQVLHRPQVHLGARQERLHAHVDAEPALDHLDHAPLDRRALLVGLGDGVPHLDLVGLVLGQDDEALGVFLGLEVDLDLLAHLRQTAVTVELLDRDRALALVADVDQDLAGAHVDDSAADDLALLELTGRRALLEPVLHPFLGTLALRAGSAEISARIVRRHAPSSSVQ